MRSKWTNNPNRVVIIGLNYSTTLGLAKSFGEAGYKCDVAKRCLIVPNVRPIEGSSRYVSECVYLKMEEEERMVSSLIQQFYQEGSKRLLLPSDDFCSSLIDKNYNRLSQYFFLPNCNKRQGAMRELMNKQFQKKSAIASGLNVPKSWEVRLDDNYSYVVPLDIEYPCFIKPLESVRNTKSIMCKCDSREHLSDCLQEIPERFKCNLLVEQYVEIDAEYTIPVLACNNQVDIPAMLRKTLVSKGYHKGVTIAGEVIDALVYDDFVRKLKCFIKQLGIEGIFDVEVFESNGTFYFNELNLRTGAAGYALTASGVNLPAKYADHVFSMGTESSIDEFELNRTFVSDKAALEYFEGGFCNLRGYLSIIKNNNYHLLLKNESLELKLSFHKRIFIGVAKYIVKRLLKK